MKVGHRFSQIFADFYLVLNMVFLICVHLYLSVSHLEIANSRFLVFPCFRGNFFSTPIYHV
jgi:hypothetical protein